MMITLQQAVQESMKITEEINDRDCQDMLNEFNDIPELIAMSESINVRTRNLILQHPGNTKMMLLTAIQVAICKGIWLGRRQFTDLGEINESNLPNL